MAGAVQRDDGLAGSRAAADPGRPVVPTFDQLALGGMQEDLPPGERLGEDRPQRLVVAGDLGCRAFDRGSEVVGVDRFAGADGVGHLLQHLLEGLAVV